MSESPAAGWVSDAPTPAQLKEFFAQVESGRITKDLLQKFLRSMEFAGTVIRFPIWKTITLGTGFKTADDFHYALKNGEFRVGKWADDILDRFKPAAKKQKIDLVAVSVAELGFPDGATMQEIYNRAQELGLDLCPAEVGPQLRLQYKDQPMEWLVIGMEALTDSGGLPAVFCVYRDGGGLWLSSYYGYSGSALSGDSRWVFRRK